MAPIATGKPDPGCTPDRPGLYGLIPLFGPAIYATLALLALIGPGYCRPRYWEVLTGRIDDLLSGYRVFSRRFVKSFPALATGFETETELTVHALALRMPIAEVATDYGARPDGSHSKLSTWRDGLRILVTALRLFEKERPLIFFGILTLLFATASLLLALPIVAEFLATGLVPRFPTAILATALMILAALSLSVGLIIDAITHARRELRRLAYLAIPAPHR